MRDTTSRGDISELSVAAALALAGKKLLRPISSATRYDLAIDNQDGTVTRVQCKTGRLRDGRIEFRVASVSGHTTDNKPYLGQIDAFGVFCPENRAVYLIPMSAVEHCGTLATLRVSPARNGQKLRVRFATDFLIEA